ncbi:hypothetical protein A2715_02590 [Candidatus Woesebacteria bacterium RIFCSPHIGHO2_01_FULL_39_32]|uniref:SD-repeat containing protein B domain-containing protein n=1 Tax=Candidatus Woesebacteria bacterium RIFCSPLOWO2_01_FULL_39_25 TaxID=1802521 RepID=A0A1F8BJY1_9BACT|nr:MAG: hypothetical protein A2715_02590 [Candidatus Woesebacteria bacterium RIFCSPHIGHO2_01_FULL_39_32]OGM38040.1 MAG: hypothetical protein A3F01_05900 [Candidatus Woesebacteria bacterium RIFCSPHIGHO2_12_FULL_38_11]OGM64384.1 MAG: hypothetical protein A2893_00765 [Candidatus Woesebacteria bacterium RIFCSPLOWO2_01_FULL_39_25]
MYYKLLKSKICIFILLALLTTNYSTTSADSEKPGLIKAFAYNEHKGNGVFDQQDYGMEGWNICLEKKGEVLEVCKLSDENGKVEWSEVAPGTYTIGEKLSETQKKAGWFVNEPNSNTSYEAVVDETETRYFLLGQEIEKVSFGNRLAEIHGHVTYDQNLDGISQLNEPLLGRWQVYLDLNKNGKIDNSLFWQGCTDMGVISDCLPNGEEPYLCSNPVDGTWHIRQIPKGTYMVRLVPKEGWSITGNVSYTLSVNGSSGIQWSDFAVAKIDNSVPSDDELIGTCTDYSDTFRVYKQSPTPTLQPTPLPTPIPPEPSPTPTPFRFYLRKKLIELLSVFF